MRWLAFQAAIASLLVYCLSLTVEQPAQAAEKLVASSVCEAQELKAKLADDPHLEIEIPAEFDRPFPSLEACRSHDLAWDPDAPGPLQPIPFRHKPHAGDFEIECLY